MVNAAINEFQTHHSYLAYAGAIFTDDDRLADIIRSLRVHGQGTDKYDNVRIGMTGRLDTIQAAVLIEKLKVFGDEIAMRNRIAARYNEGLRPHVAAVPDVPEGNISNWAQYTIEHEDRDGLAAHLKEQGVPTAVYYPIPLHLQPAYAAMAHAQGAFPEAERTAQQTLSLPMFPQLPDEHVERTIEQVLAFFG